MDKSVTKLWKDPAGGRSYWLGAIGGFTWIVQIALALHGRAARVKRKNFKTALKALYTAGFSFFTCPLNVWMGLWIRCVHMAVTQAGQGSGMIDQFSSKNAISCCRWKPVGACCQLIFSISMAARQPKQGEHDVQHPVYYRRDLRFW